ncbi:invasion associated locus B family protein [Chelatococcus composti]|jgi:hypothetical protein|uniref:Invasion associated locus B family protein n=1 Tax=Chelatococcus composti TaxID=1743235 RepID=A0A841KCR9_9HYPH|nr:invasion associated locus B family protein [Chelatococcus composti]MBB6169172.1 hypothetical protein [Chelatococcus composti]
MIRGFSARPGAGLFMIGAAVIVLAASQPAAAQGTGQATLLASYGDWGAYASGQGRSRVCYAMTQPKQRLPAGLNRDPAYLFVSKRPAENVRNEVSFVMGFPTRENVDARATVGDASFALVTKGEHAWVKDPAQEGQVVTAFQRGAKLVVNVESRRGNKLTDEYSLSGFTQAWKRVNDECK